MRFNADNYIHWCGRMFSVPVCPSWAPGRRLSRNSAAGRPERRDQSREGSSIHYQVIKPKNALIGKSSVTQEGSILDREVWPERGHKITGSMCCRLSNQKDTIESWKQIFDLSGSGCHRLLMFVLHCFTALLRILVEENRDHSEICCDNNSRCKIFHIRAGIFYDSSHVVGQFVCQKMYVFLCWDEFQQTSLTMKSKT